MMMFEHREPLSVEIQDGALVRRNDGRFAVMLDGIVLIVRSRGTIIRTKHVDHDCEIEEIQLSTWQYQLLPGHYRETWAHLIKIVEE